MYCTTPRTHAPSDRRGAESVCLDLGKATNLVREGVELHKSGRERERRPTRKYDRAFERLVELTRRQGAPAPHE